MNLFINKEGINDSRSKSFPIVAIGASAGGLEAMTEFLQELPSNTGMAYVYIQHLDRDYKSNLSEILQRHTSMNVVEAKHLIPIKQDHLYVIPPDKDLSIVDGVIKVSKRSPKPSLHLPVNKFFMSLAEKQKEGAIGIILSGTASDGTLGLKAIKMAGGFTFAQDDSALFNSMPRAAIAEGVVDAVMSPSSIAKELEHFSRKGNLLSSIITPENLDDIDDDQDIDDNPFPIKDEDISIILSLLKSSTSVDFTHYKEKTIHRRIIRRMLLHKIDTLTGYVDYLKDFPKEIDTLYNDLLINVTRFFRDEEASEYLRKKILPGILKSRSANNPLRIWVPACSTGEEAYSIGMIVLELLGENAGNIGIQIFATDLSEIAITKARMAVYSMQDVSSIPQQRLQRFFTKVDGHYRVIKQLRDICVFAPHNIFKDPPFSRLDIISCCNLLIYLDNTLQKKIFGSFYYALKDDGYLVLGKSESVSASASLYKQTDKGVKIFQKKKNIGVKSTLDLQFSLEGRDRNSSVKKLKQYENTYASEEVNLIKVVDQVFLTRYTPAGVVINQNMDILQFRGSTGAYLEPLHGTASLNLLKMAREGLSYELRAAVTKVIKTNKSYTKDGIAVKNNDNTILVSIEVSPIERLKNEQIFLVIFKEMPGVLTIDGASQPGDSARIEQLENEVQMVRAEMRALLEEQEAANEELQSANEEIVSSNEELQSINEELETSKEEVESSNEELMTINQELLVRNEQLTEAQEYTAAVVSTIREAVLILDSSLRVKSANESFYRIFLQKPADTEDVMFFEMGNKQWDTSALRKLLQDIAIRKTSFTGVEIKHTFAGIGEKVLLLNAKHVSRKLHSEPVILLAIEDITEHKQAERLLEEREAWLRNMADNVPIMIWVAGPDKNFNYLNKTWLAYTGNSLPKETGIGWTKGVHSDDLGKVLTTYHSAFDEHKPFKIKYRMQRADKEWRWVLNSAVPTFSEGEFTGYTGTCIEIHDERKLNQELEKKVQERTVELKRANNDLEQSNNELQQFAYVASHDLQEPLRKIITFTNRIFETFGDDVPEGAKEYLVKIIHSSERLTSLIDDVLNFSKMSRLPRKFKQTHLHEIINAIQEDLELLVQEKKANIQVGNLPVITAIPLQMSQLFYNLLNNALKFSKPGKHAEITIDCRELTEEEKKKERMKTEMNYYLITVKDNGIGFPQEFSEQIFVIFQRLYNKDQFSGTGIGLALCRKIVHNHGGNITANSTPGNGAQFNIILPEHQNGFDDSENQEPTGL